MKSFSKNRYQDNRTLTVQYPDGIWQLIASFIFGGFCWYLGYRGALAEWLLDWPVTYSYLFFVLMVAIIFFYIRLVIVILDKKQNWLVNPEKRAGMQLFFCCILPTLLLFWIIGPDPQAKDEWLLFPLMVIFSGILVLNMSYTVYFYVAVYHRQKILILEQKETILQQESRTIDLQEQIELLSPGIEELKEILETAGEDRDVDAMDEIDLALLRSMDLEQEVFLLNNKILSQKISYKDIGIFTYKNGIVSLYLRTAMDENLTCGEQRSLKEVVNSTKGFVQKIDRDKAIPLDMIQACQQLKRGRLRIVLKIPFEGRYYFEVSDKIAKHIREWVMLQVPIEKEQ
ncbi:hypothetical protein ACR784_11420 [Sphingobacterium multivorum]|uniref:hypothetical protein n=1 Tax=Sphingobacterium TaxID=28453 RepID=UPI0028AA020E|nr:hypothetical protein [Sphingobacterium multivorum]